MKNQLNIKNASALMAIAALFILFKDANAQILPEYSAFTSSPVGVQLGTQGLGIRISRKISSSFNINVGLNTVPGVTVQYNSRDLKLSRTSIYATADWQPLYGNNQWVSRKWFISAGLGYYFTNELYREGVGTLPNYTISMPKLMPYLGTGLGNIRLFDNIVMRADMGYYIPTTATTSSYGDKANKVTTGLRGILPGLNAGITLSYKF